jgi:asparagine synthase (glutamine-hydrolysing)
MCGFVGHVSLDNTIIQKSRLIDSVNILKNRGPDNLGFEIGKKFGFAFRRLSIIDLSSNANQPMFSNDKNYICVFNGEIYNYRDIYLEIKDDFLWKSNSDTELLLNSWIKWGPKCLEKLDGMFSFAIWDEKKSSLYAARDRIGEKPFYYYIKDKNFYFASRPSALLNQIPEVSREYDPQSIRSFLDAGYIPGSNTIYKSIKKLTAGTYIEFSEKGFFINTYWQLKNINTNFELINRKEADLIDELESIIIKSLEKRFVSDVPVGVFLSSGIDSSLIAAIAKKKLNLRDNIKTFSIGFSDKRYDESVNSRKIANFLGTDHYESIVNPNDLINLMPKFFQNFDEPFFDSSAFPLMAVSNLASKHVKVVLTGDGGDELFGGYNYYKIIKILKKIDFLPSYLKKSLSCLLSFIPEYKINLISEILKKNNLIESFAFARSIIKKNHNVLFNEVINETIGIDGIFKKTFSSFNSNIGIVEACMKLDIIYTLNDDYLQKSDLSTMSYSIESRSPFLSRELVEWSARLPLKYKINFFEKKYILKKLLSRFLPENLINKKKMGFEAPIREWMSKDLYKWSRDIIYNVDYYKNLPINQDKVKDLFTLLLNKKKGIHPYLWSILMLLEFNKRQLSR